MNILSIETSCDETAVSVLKCEGGVDSPQFEVLGNALYSQAKEHAEYGGVYPNVAKREHAKNLVPLLDKALDEADIGSDERLDISDEAWRNIENILKREEVLCNKLYSLLHNTPKPDVDAVAVTKGPGLEPALWVGINFAKALSVAWNVPFVPVNHLEAHLFTPLIDTKRVNFPAVGLIVSGGHTQLIHAKSMFEYEIIGETQDDAVGEAFDKVARMLDLPYPGGPEISQLAETHRKSHTKSNIDLPRPMINSGDYNFSFSGLKTSVLYLTRELKEKNGDDALTKEQKQAIAHEFEDAVIDVLVSKTKNSLEEYTPKTLILGGGVVANQKLREDMKNIIEKWSDVELLLPPSDLSTDNAVMVGIVGYLRYSRGDVITDTDEIISLRANGRLRL